MLESTEVEVAGNQDLRLHNLETELLISQQKK